MRFALIQALNLAVLGTGVCAEARAQQPPAAVPTEAASSAGTAISLDEAISRARANEPNFAAAAAAARIAGLDRSIARAGLLPTAVYHNQFLYTQPNGARNGAGAIGSQSAPRFIANNTVHEYASQGVVTETLGLAQVTAVARATAAAAVATAELEIMRRGLVAAVVGLYFGELAAEDRLKVATRALAEADAFTNLTRARELAREAAHADVVKAELAAQARRRELADAGLAVERARLDLGVLLFPDPRSAFRLLEQAARPTLPARSEIDAAAARRNPEMESALASLRGANLDITAARAAYLPDLALNVTYGIDAAQVAAKGPDNTRNLGYSAFATLDIPVWDWLATAHRVKQAEIGRDAARVALSAAQRRLIADLEEAYAEATVAREQIDSLAESVRTAGESLRLTRLRYGAAEATVLEVVDAQNSLVVAENARADGDVRYRTALANLQVLTGSLP